MVRQNTHESIRPRIEELGLLILKISNEDMQGTRNIILYLQSYSKDGSQGSDAKLQRRINIYINDKLHTLDSRGSLRSENNGKIILKSPHKLLDFLKKFTSLDSQNQQYVRQFVRDLQTQSISEDTKIWLQKIQRDIDDQRYNYW